MLVELLNLALCNFFFVHSNDLHSVNSLRTTSIPLFKYLKKIIEIVQPFPYESAMVTRKAFRRMSFSSCFIVWRALLQQNRCSYAILER